MSLQINIPHPTSGNFISLALRADFDSFIDSAKYTTDFLHRSVVGGVVEGRENTFLVVSGQVETGSLCSLGEGVFMVGNLVEVGWDFIGLELCRQWDGVSVGTILVPDECLHGERTLHLLSHPFSRVKWTRVASYYLPHHCIIHLPTICGIPYWAEINSPVFQTMAVLSTIAQEQEALPVFGTRQAYIFQLFRQGVNSISLTNSPLFAATDESIVGSDKESFQDLEELEKIGGISCSED